MKNQIFGEEKKGERSIHDIPLPESRIHKKDTLDLSGMAQKREVSPQATRGNDTHDVKGWNTMKGKNKRKGLKLAIIGVVLVIVFFILSIFLHSATMSIELKQVSVPVVETFTAQENGGAEAIAFSRPASFEQTNTIFVPGTTQENVQTQSSGTITVSNSGSVAQRFRATTRFETPDGKIYRAPRSIPIPARGSVEVEVVADTPGAEYNSVGGLTFTLPGLDGSAIESQITAVQSGPIDGGFSGVMTSASDSDIEAGENTLRRELDEQLRAELSNRVPDGFTIFPELVEISDISFNEAANAEKDGIDLQATASVFAIMFNKSDFDSFVASSVLKDYTPDQSISIQNIENFVLTVEDNDFDIQESSEFDFSLRSNGNGEFTWTINENEIKRAVSGKSARLITPSAIEELNGANSVEVKISPFWRSKVSNNIKKIDVVINE